MLNNAARPGRRIAAADSLSLRIPRRRSIPGSTTPLLALTAAIPSAGFGGRTKVVATAAHADFLQADLTHLLEHAAVFLIFFVMSPPPQLWQHVVTRLVDLAHILLLLLRLAAAGIRLQEHIEEGRDGGIGLGGAHGGAAGGAGIRVCGSGALGLP